MLNGKALKRVEWWKIQLLRGVSSCWEEEEEGEIDPRLNRKKRQAILPFYPVFSTRRSRRRWGTSINMCYASLLSGLPTPTITPTTPTHTTTTHTTPMPRSTLLERSPWLLPPLPTVDQQLLLPPPAPVAVLQQTSIACPTATTTITCRTEECRASREDSISVLWTPAPMNDCLNS